MRVCVCVATLYEHVACWIVMREEYCIQQTRGNKKVTAYKVWQTAYGFIYFDSVNTHTHTANHQRSTYKLRRLPAFMSEAHTMLVIKKSLLLSDSLPHAQSVCVLARISVKLFDRKCGDDFTVDRNTPIYPKSLEVLNPYLLLSWVMQFDGSSILGTD